MREIKQFGWVYYLADVVNLEKDKSGKWMYFFDDNDFISKLCKDAVSNNIVVESKHSDAENGVACFYLNYDDMDAHKRTIKYFLDNNLIRKTKAGKLYNISFKLNEQTREGVYGNAYNSEIKLSNFVNLINGEWI
jgi:hypothetical protein